MKQADSVNQAWWKRAAGKVQARLGLYGVLVLALGVLLWSRLLLVTRPPRVAIAEPSNMLVQPAEQMAPSGAGKGAPDGADSKVDLELGEGPAR